MVPKVPRVAVRSIVCIDDHGSVVEGEVGHVGGHIFMFV